MSRHQINAPAVVSEVIDGEAVIMNLLSGHYFSAQGVGAAVWTRVEAGWTAAEIVAELSRTYGAAHVATPVADFIAALQEHGLVVERVSPTPDPTVSVEYPPSWSAPTLGVFTDMEDLLLLDPIHDVGEAGWPMPKAADDGAR